MNKKLWVLLNNGPSVDRIRKKKRVEEVRGLFNIVERVQQLKPDEYLPIPVEQIIFPLNPDTLREQTGREFKKRGDQFNLKIPPKYIMKQHRITPQQSIITSVERAYQGLENRISQAKDEREEIKLVNQVLKRGFHWTIDRRHIKLSQRDLMRGWRFASLIITEDMDLAYSNPGQNFIITLPTTTKDPSQRYSVTLFNLALEFPEAYSEWPFIDGKVSVSESTDLKGTDMFTGMSHRYTIPELVLNFQLVAAMILRQHFTDDRFHQGKFTTQKSVIGQKIPKVKLNIPIPPTQKLIDFDWKLDHNVIIGYRTSSNKLDVKKLNAAEREVLYCTYLFSNGSSQAYFRDEPLDFLDQVVAYYRKKFENHV